MEKLQSLASLSNIDSLAATVVPFEPVTLQRPMRAFSKIIGLTPGITAPPDPEFLTYLLTGRPSHTAILRHALGDHFKNFENHLRARHRTSATTLKTLSRALDVPVEELGSWAHGLQDGPLFPGLQKWFQVLEGIPLQVATSVLSAEVPCPQCGHNVLEDVDAWWPRQTVVLAAPEYRFVERILRATEGGMTFLELLNLLTGSTKPQDKLSQFAHPRRHPMGHWLNAVQKECGCRNLPELSVRMELAGGRDWSPSRMKKWSSGQDLIPAEAVEALAAATGRAKYFDLLHVTARALTFALEFVIAAAQGDTPSTRKQVLQVLHDRLVQLEGNIAIGMRTRRRAVDQRR